MGSLPEFMQVLCENLEEAGDYALLGAIWLLSAANLDVKQVPPSCSIVYTLVVGELTELA